jgi:ubiquinol-cytochrome c reductase cytochrome b subunit
MNINKTTHNDSYLLNKSCSGSLNADSTMESWNQWLAGLIDADGSLLLSPAGYTSLEITMDIFDEHALLQIKQKLGGSVKLRTNARAFRYRLHSKQPIINLVNTINGYIRNSKRVIQLQKMCEKLEIQYIDPKSLSLESAWFSGFFDGDGTLSYSFKNGYPQLTISVSNKKKIDCQPFQEYFGGVVRLDKRSNTYKWEIYQKEQILAFCAYLKKYPLKSHKKTRILLVPRYFKLCAIRAYTYSKDTLTYKAWAQFEKKWAY